ncbi:flagellar motor switch protein FliM [Ramlibacter sp.]|uniref:flagellar motor switch protein FliM n=1 Tax=Ramlibacter sp. TaxID=1917967 RepID=UPI003D0EC990
MTQSLSQEEVDALVDRAGGEPASPGSAAAPDASGVRAYDLSSQERIVRGRMPALDSVHEHFVRNLGEGIFGFMRRHADVAAAPVKVQKFGDFIGSVTAPTSINVMHVRPLRGAGLLILEPALVFAIVDALFGGAAGKGGKAANPQAREFSATEQRIIARFVAVICAAYTRSWAPIHPVELELARSEVHPRFASVATPAEMTIAATFNVLFGESGGALHLCIPYSTFEPIRDVLHSPPPGNTAAPDSRWLHLLTQQVQSATVELAAELAYSQATVRELVALKTGDFIELDRAPTLTVKVDSVPVFECDYGTLGARYGLRIREFLTQSAAAASTAAAAPSAASASVSASASASLSASVPAPVSRSLTP